jgi:hypothetical protein
MSTIATNRPFGIAQRARVRDLGDWVAFLIPFSGAFVVSFGGTLPYTEVIFLLFFPILVLTDGQFITPGHRVFDKEYRTAYILLGLWVLSQTLTDIFVNAAPLDRVKGLARVVFFALDLVSIAAIVGTSLRRTKIFALGMVSNYLYSDRYGGDWSVQWKMLVGPSVSILVFLVASHFYTRRQYGKMLLVVAGLAALNLHYASRSGMMIDLAAALLILPIFPKTTLKRHSFTRGQLSKVLVLGALTLAVIWVSQQILKTAVNAGLFSEGDQAKYEQQSQGKLGIIFGGRPEGLVAIQAIMDSPFLGHGSYAVDYKYYVLLQEYRYKYGYAEGDDVDVDDVDIGIPTHSHLTMSWVEGGALASLFWFYMLVQIGRSISRLTENTHPLGPLYMFLLINLTWDILFSPYGLTRRMFEAFFLVIMINVLRSTAVPHERIDMRVGRSRPVLRRARILRPVRSFRHG